MEAWIFFWGLLLLVTLIFYTVLVAYVAVGGLKDIRQMFKILSRTESNKDFKDED